MGALSEFEEYVRGLSGAEKKELDAIIADELKAVWLPDPDNVPQCAAYYSQADLMLYGGAAGAGKALALDTPIPVPSGWATMGSLRVGDTVFDEMGCQRRVSATSAVMIHRDCYKIAFSDGSSVIADGEHLWFTMTAADRMAELRQSASWRENRHSKRASRSIGKRPDLALMNAARQIGLQRDLGSVKTTKDIGASLLIKTRLNHSVPVQKPLQCDGVDLPIDPYLFGAWLGDGTSSCAAMTIAEDEMRALVEDAAAVHGWELSSRSDPIAFGITGGFQGVLRKIGVLNAKAVPQIYLRASADQRLALLQGLMDTDGHVDARGSCEFTNTRVGLAVAVAELVRSLGCKANVTIGDAILDGRVIGDKFRVHFSPHFEAFRLSRKASRLASSRRRPTTAYRYIESVEPVASVPVRCIAVDSPSKLFLCGTGMIPTHNTSLLVGLAATAHERSVIFRSKSVDLRSVEEYLLEVMGRDGWNGQDKILRRPTRVIELAHLEKPGSEKSWQGRPHDLIGFDEGAQLARAKVQFVLGWLRSVNPKQRRRAVIASNPPTGGDGEWLIEWFAPWLDEKFPNPAAPGELRWAATASDREGTTVWLVDGDPIVFTDGRKHRQATPAELAMSPQEARLKGIEVTRPLRRTFIPGRLEDNPYLRDTGYRAQLQTLPEPLRSQMLHGDFMAGRQDHEWQVIPTAWVKAAQARWTERPPEDAIMTAIAADVAQGGADDTVVSPRHGTWYAPLIAVPGVETPRPSDVAALIVRHRRNNAAIVVDVGGGYGGGVKERLEENDIPVRPFNGANSPTSRTADKQLEFVNMRAQAAWKFREALDPDQAGGSKIALPPDPQLTADLTAPRWKLASGGIQIESKDDLKRPDRLGRSPDKGDAVIMAWSEGERAIIAGIKRRERLSTAGIAPKLPVLAVGPRGQGTGWMGN